MSRNDAKSQVTFNGIGILTDNKNNRKNCGNLWKTSKTANERARPRKFAFEHYFKVQTHVKPASIKLLY